MSEIRDGSRTPRDEVEELVFLYLEEREQGLVKTYEDFARRHSSSGDAVRDRILALERAGLMDGEGSERAPERLGSFRIVARLGGGGMGVVYAAEETTLGRRVALKVIRPEQSYFPQAKERFRREVEAVAKLAHPGIVQVYSFAEESGVPFFAMELVEGASLGDVLARLAGRDPASLSGADLARVVSEAAGAPCAASPLFDGTWVRSAIEIARQVALALEHAHARGVVHRDVKPSNVMITPDGRARLLDFGLASSAGASRLTKTGAQLGSLPYMPPEVVEGAAEQAGPACDVYSLGATLHEALALRLPFRGETTALLAQRIVKGEHESLRRANPDVSVDAETICGVAMEVDPARRYASAGALAADLAAVLERRPIAARRTSAWIHARRWVERNPAAAAAGLLGALLLVGGPAGYGVLQANAAEKERGLNEDLRKANRAAQDANAGLERANAELAGSLRREQDVSARAERNFQSACDAISEMLVAVGADELREVPRLGPVRRTLLERAQRFYGRLQVEDPDSITVQRELARTTRSIGAVLDDLSRPAEALEQYRKAVELSRQVLERDPDSLSTRHMYASNLMQLAKKQHQMGQLDDAREIYATVLPIAEKLLQDMPDNPRFMHDMGSALLDLGGFHMAQGDEQAALADRERAVAVVRPALPLAPARDRATYVVQLATCLNGLANAEEHAGLHARALASRREAWETTVEGLTQHPDARELRLQLTETAVNYGLSLATTDPGEAETVLERGFETGLALSAEFPEDLEVRHVLAAVASNLGYHFTNQARWGDALEALDEAVRQAEVLVQRDGSRPDFKSSLATSLGNRSTAQLGLDRLAAARGDAERGVAAFEALRREFPRHPIVLAGAAACGMQLAEVERAEGDWRRARATTDAAMALGVQRSDISFQAFETYWHVARAAGADPALAAEERERAFEELVELALGRLDEAIEQGYADLDRLESFPDYEGLRERERYQDALDAAASAGK